MLCGKNACLKTIGCFGKSKSGFQTGNEEPVYIVSDIFHGYDVVFANSAGRLNFGGIAFFLTN